MGTAGPCLTIPMARWPIDPSPDLKKLCPAADEDSNTPSVQRPTAVQVISMNEHLDCDSVPNHSGDLSPAPEPSSILLSTYRALLADIAECGESICPVLSTELKSSLARIDEELSQHSDARQIVRVRNTVYDLLQDWGKKTAQHYLDKAGELKGLLLVMARTAESLEQKRDRCVHQLESVTAQLQSIAGLDDLSKMRATLAESALDLKHSIDQMSAESRSVIDHLRAEVMTYRARLEKAEHLASCDALTGLGTRLWVKSKMQERIQSRSCFSVLMIDIKAFRRVNDEFGRMVGDLLLQEFARELHAFCPFSNLVSRWSGNTFLVVLDAAPGAAIEQAERLRAWLSNRQYAVPGRPGHASVRLDSAIGFAVSREGDTLQDILGRAHLALAASGKPGRQRISA